MAASEIHGVTPHPFDQFRALMDAAVARSTVAPMLSTEWRGTEYHVSGPGVVALGRYENGRVRVEVTLSFPASMLKGQILADIERSMREAGCHSLQTI
jgi:Putative polyhydroxyalkanoic acid system protein (PHA_gran_rgn)